ncbi:hypothetical protein DSLASN_31370 [Desulfoluna limicola]|uniref:Uncharacterized protein n=1 Tax=Desulfoluna limicola TaxID=2810562 RepID=A0ABM7PK13_9BACT|nr:hypothetical protein DSLASN_31370 [Desulfoluna limicola]
MGWWRHWPSDLNNDINDEACGNESAGKTPPWPNTPVAKHLGGAIAWPAFYQKMPSKIRSGTREQRSQGIDRSTW